MTPDHLPFPRDPARSEDEFVRLVRMLDGEVTMPVYTTRWLTPHTPSSRRVIARRKSGLDSEAQGRAMVEEVLWHPAVFGTCEECGDHNPGGWIHSETPCQGCAQTNHRVVYWCRSLPIRWMEV